MAPLTEPPSPERAALLEGLRALGYVERRNLTIEYRSAEMEADFLPQLAAELVKAGVELIFAVESNVVIAVLKASPTIPIVFVSIMDPVEMKFAQSLARPDKSVTGITLLGVNLAPKRLELLRDLLPRAKRIAVLRGGTGTGVTGEWLAVKPAAGGLVSLAPNFAEQFGRAASYVDRILKGARPGELAIEQPTTFELVINLKTAKVLGISVPQSQLIRATRVID